VVALTRIALVPPRRVLMLALEAAAPTPSLRRSADESTAGGSNSACEGQAGSMQPSTMKTLCAPLNRGGWVPSRGAASAWAACML
jgi:hypothetical protein